MSVIIHLAFLTILNHNGIMENENTPNLGGRPLGANTYTHELRDKICDLLAQGKTLRFVCKIDGMPERQTIYNWLHNNIGEVKDEQGNIIEHGFFDHYTRAREIGLDEVADETLDIADDGTNDYVELVNSRGTKKIILDKEAVMRSRLRVDARLAYLANMAPRKYGKNVKVENQTLDKDGKPTDPVSGNVAVVVAQDSLAAALENIKNGKARGEEVERNLADQERTSPL